MMLPLSCLLALAALVLAAPLAAGPATAQEAGAQRGKGGDPGGDRGFVALGPGEGRRVDLDNIGIFNVTKLGGGELGSGFDVVETMVAPQAGPPVHIHNSFDEAFYVLDGTFRVRLGEETVDAPEGAFVYIPRGVPHTWMNTGELPGRLLSLGTPASLETFLLDLSEAIAEPEADRAAAMAKAYARQDTDVVGPPMRSSEGGDR